MMTCYDMGMNYHYIETMKTFGQMIGQLILRKDEKTAPSESTTDEQIKLKAVANGPILSVSIGWIISILLFFSEIIIFFATHKHK